MPAYCFVLLFTFALVPREYPTLVRRILEAPPPKTSQIEWTMARLDGYDHGLVERFVTRTAGATRWENNRGDENGFHETAFRQTAPEQPDNGLRSSEPPPGVPVEDAAKYMIPKEELAGTCNYLVHDAQMWRMWREERPLAARVAPLENADSWFSWQPMHVESLSLAPCFESRVGGNAFRLPPSYAEGLESAVFRQETVGPTTTVSADWGSFRLKWSFDERRGGQAVGAALYRDGELLSHSQTEVQQTGERWLPKSVQFYKGYSPTPDRVVEVQRATFDEPWHMQEITPVDIGLLNGTQVSGPAGDQVWSGADLIPREDFWNLVFLYDLPPDRRILELFADPKALKPDPKKVEAYLEWLSNRGKLAREEYKKKHGEEPWTELTSLKESKEKDEWDVYVEKFLEEHKLPEWGIKRANEIRDDAKRRRDAQRIVNRPKIKEARSEGAEKKLVYYQTMENRIFERMLVRPLRKLADRAEEKSP